MPVSVDLALWQQINRCDDAIVLLFFNKIKRIEGSLKQS